MAKRLVEYSYENPKNPNSKTVNLDEERYRGRINIYIASASRQVAINENCTISLKYVKKLNLWEVTVRRQGFFRRAKVKQINISSMPRHVYAMCRFVRRREVETNKSLSVANWDEWNDRVAREREEKPVVLSFREILQKQTDLWLGDAI